MVDYEPWKGNYSNVVVRENTIYGGFATSPNNGSTTDGEDEFTAIIKLALCFFFHTSLTSLENIGSESLLDPGHGSVTFISTTRA